MLSGRKLDTRRQTAAVISKLEETTMTSLLIPPPGLSGCRDSTAILWKREAEKPCAELAKLPKWPVNLECCSRLQAQDRWSSVSCSEVCKARSPARNTRSESCLNLSWKICNVVWNLWITRWRHSRHHRKLFVWVCVWICMCVSKPCICVCVCVCVFVCVYGLRACNEDEDDDNIIVCGMSKYWYVRICVYICLCPQIHDLKSWNHVSAHTHIHEHVAYAQMLTFTYA